MNSDEKSKDGPLLVVVLAELRLLLPRSKLCLGESGESGEGSEGIGEAGLFGQLHLLVARRLSGLNPSVGSKTG